MHCLVPLLLIIPHVSAAIRCFSGQETFPGQGIPFTEVNCPNADFCFNNYVKRHHNGDDSYTITKSCGEPGKCFVSGLLSLFRRLLQWNALIRNSCSR
ncbi:hypothetical protein OESDEN_21177 [Oesophagostomum dentatum]|uniref:Uncharacterized protein n=1 Tax=Oesophagostomum dentatum TaxID=61180 RepID=A0A0B1S1I0_OESDE|nr:hypothetical protein OESDEN_21177 [Oesophagostomum dentatum]